MHKRLLTILMCVLALSLSSLGASKKKTVATGAPDKAYLQKLMDGWSAGNPANMAQYYDQGDYTFFDIVPLKYNNWAEYQKGVEEVLKGYKSFKLKVNDDAQMQTDGNAVLAQPVAIAMHALDRAAPPAGSAVLVVGAGAVGALLVAAAADAGLAVHVVDLDAGRLDAARRLGATATGLIEPAVGTSPFRGISAVFETSGSAAGLGLALTAAAPGGRIVAVGLPARPFEFDSRTAVVSEVDVITSSAHVCQRDLPAAVGLLSRRRLDEVIVAQVIGLDRIVSDGLARMASGAVRGKTVVDVLAPC